MAYTLAIYKILQYNNSIHSKLLLFNILIIKSHNILEVHDGTWSVQKCYR